MSAALPGVKGEKGTSACPARIAWTSSGVQQVMGVDWPTPQESKPMTS